LQCVTPHTERYTTHRPLSHERVRERTARPATAAYKRKFVTENPVSGRVREQFADLKQSSSRNEIFFGSSFSFKLRVFEEVARRSAHELSHDQVVDEWCVAEWCVAYGVLKFVAAHRVELLPLHSSCRRDDTAILFQCAAECCTVSQLIASR